MFRHKVYPSITKSELKYIETRYDDPFELIFEELHCKGINSRKTSVQVERENGDHRKKASPLVSKHAWEENELPRQSIEPSSSKQHTERITDNSQTKSSICVII